MWIKLFYNVEYYWKLRHHTHIVLVEEVIKSNEWDGTHWEIFRLALNIYFDSTFPIFPIKSSSLLKHIIWHNDSSKELYKIQIFVKKKVEGRKEGDRRLNLNRVMIWLMFPE